MSDDFTQLNLQAQLVQTVTELGYETPTPVQSAVIPLMLAGHDVIAQAQTGTGKTAAFALPALQTLEAGRRRVQCLVVAPTRELALQVTKAMYDYGQGLGVRVLSVYGGQPYGRQMSRLQKGVEIVVGTPGRLLDLIRKGALDLSHVRTVVLDEADEMLSMGFIEDIEAILAETPAERQTALFSATLPTAIRKLAQKYMRDPQTVMIENKQRTVAAVEQRYYMVNERDKLAALTRLFEVEEMDRALIFARTRVRTGELANELTQRGFPAEALNGDLSQDMRERVLNRFRSGQINVLVGTDVAARGLDIDDISHVFNFDVPQDPEVYVHRIGRTGRAGKSGVAITLLTPSEKWRLQKIERYTRQEMTSAEVPTSEAILAQREAQLLELVKVWLRRDRCRQEKEMVARLVEEGHDPVFIAAVALKLARAEEKQRPIAPMHELETRRPSSRKQRPAPRGSRAERAPSRKSHEKGMVRLSLNAGKAHSVRPNDVVGAIAYHADIPGRSLGAIHIREKHTLVDVPEKYAAKVLAKNGQYQIHRRKVEVSTAD